MHSPFHITPIKGLSKPMEGGKWTIVEEFNGNSHGQGGIDLEVMGGYVRRIHAPNEKPDEIAKNGRVWRNIGAGAYGLGEGLLDTITFGATDPLTDMGYKALQKAGGASEDEIREQNSIRGYGTAVGAIGGAVLTGGATTGSAIQQGAKGVGAGVGYGSPDSKAAQAVGTYLPLAGSIAGMAMGNVGYGKGVEAATAAGNASKAASLTKLSNIATKAEKLAQYNPYINMASAAFQTNPMEAPGMVANQITSLGAMAQPSRWYGSRVATGEEETAQATGKKKRQSGYEDMEGYAYTPSIGQPSEGPIQFRQQPVYAAEAYNYLNKYGINA